MDEYMHMRTNLLRVKCQVRQRLEKCPLAASQQVHCALKGAPGAGMATLGLRVESGLKQGTCEPARHGGAAAAGREDTRCRVTVARCFSFFSFKQEQRVHI